MKTLADLFPFQQEAVSKLLTQPSCIIGDDMGLGKTVEAIALDKLRRDLLRTERGVKYARTLVICPLSVISSWLDHFEEWMPELKVFAIDRKRRDGFAEAIKEGTHDVYIVHWDVVRLLPILKTKHWFHIIADEAHRVANRDAQVTSKSKKLAWTYLTQLTGTPCTTRPEQFWSLLNWAKPREFSSFWRFYKHFVIFQQLVTPRGQTYRKIIGVAHEDELQEMIRPYYVRRLKEEVLEDLPEKYYSTVKVDLDPYQRRIYNQMRDDMLSWIGEHQNEPLAAPQAVAKLVRLQQFACAYAQLVDVTVRRKQDDGTYLDVVETKVRLIEPSSKLDAVMDKIQENPERQFVVFSQSKQVVTLLARRLLAAKIPYGLLTGDTPQSDRGSIIAAFQTGKLRIFVGTIKAGGVGITLTAADTVIFLDRSWSPATNKQAEDRLHRIGQKNAVQVIDIIARDTIDLGRLQKLELSWQYIKRLLGDKDAKPIKPEGALI